MEQLKQFGYNLVLTVNSSKYTKVIKDKEERDLLKTAFNTSDLKKQVTDYIITNLEFKDKINKLEHALKEFKQIKKWSIT